MAKLDDNMAALAGSVGAFTLRRMKDGEVVVCQKITRRTPTRTKANMRASLPLGNLTAMARVLKDEWANLMEACPQKPVARGHFIGLNMKRDAVYFTKVQQERRFCLLCEYQISQGSLKAIVQRLTGDNCVTTDIRLSQALTAATTVGQFSTDLLSLNPEYKEGDRLTLYRFAQTLGSDALPRVSMAKAEVAIDRRGRAPLSQVADTADWCSRDGFLSLSTPLNCAGACFVHQRFNGQGEPLVSPQIILCVNPMAEAYRTNEAFEAAVESRGGYTGGEAKGLYPELAENAEAAVEGGRAYFVTVFSSDESAGCVTTGRGSYLRGTQATLTAIPAEGHRFLRWTDQRGEVVSTQPVCHLPVMADSSFTAHFE